MNRIEKTFQALRKQNKKALIPFITAGDPNLKTTVKMIHLLEAAGSSIIEIGIPFSDPLADGPVIQNANLRAFESGVHLEAIFNTLKPLRSTTEVPLVFMVYFNTIFRYGIPRFVERCIEIGIDGLIVPDLPLEESRELSIHLPPAISLIPLVAPTSLDRVKSVTSGGSGFVYCVSSLGVTGQRDTFHTDVDKFLEDVRQSTSLPLAVGFGIATKEDVHRLSEKVDGIIVGSALIEKIRLSGGDAQTIGSFIAELNPNS